MQQLGHSAMHECLWCDAFQNDAMPCGSEVQLDLAWSVSFKTKLLNLLRVAWIKTEACFVEVTHAWNNNQLPTIIKEKCS